MDSNEKKEILETVVTYLTGALDEAKDELTVLEKEGAEHEEDKHRDLTEELERGQKAAHGLVEHLEHMGGTEECSIPISTGKGQYHVFAKKVFPTLKDVGDENKKLKQENELLEAEIKGLKTQLTIWQRIHGKI